MRLIALFFTILISSLISWNLIDAKYINNAQCIDIDTKKAPISDQYSKFVNVKGKKMSYAIHGENNNQTIVILTGLGVASPILTYKPLAEALSNDFKVIIIEPFGYGASDNTKKSRTVENIVNEIHTAVHKIGLKKFYMAGHSIGGLYSLYYANRYTNDMLGFIGLDNVMPISEFDYKILSDLSANNECNPNLSQDILLEEAKERMDPKYNYTENDLNTYSTIIENTLCKCDGFDENAKFFDNQIKCKKLKFPKSIHSIQFLADEMVKSGVFNYTEEFYINNHKKLTYKSPLNKVIYMKDSSHFIFFEQKESIVNEIKSWVKKLNKK